MNLYRRHRKNCPHRRKGCKYTGCNCPIWIDGDRDGRQFRVSLKLKDWQRAIDDHRTAGSICLGGPASDRAIYHAEVPQRRP